MTLEEGQALLRAGTPFGGVYEAVYSDNDKELLKAFYLGDPALPNLAARAAKPAGATPAPMTANQAREAGYTGDVCSVCQGCRMRRNGACLLCEDCKNSSGCS